MSRGRAALLLVALVSLGGIPARAQVRLHDEGDRAAFRSWFVFLADAQFYTPTPDVTDCAALVRHAFREALRTHSPEWLRQAALPITPPFADVQRPPRPTGDAWPLFRVAADRYAEFADAATIIRLNARFVGRDVRAARPGDLLFFHQPEQHEADHLMVFVGRSMFEDAGTDWVVYHTGPDTARAGLPADARSANSGLPAEARSAKAGLPRRSREAAKAGEVRKVHLKDLLQHPSPRWRPVAANDRFAGVYRLEILW